MNTIPLWPGSTKTLCRSPWLSSIIKAWFVAHLCNKHHPPQVRLLFCNVIKQLVPFFSICTPVTERLVRLVPQVDRRGMQSTGATDNDWTHPTTSISCIKPVQRGKKKTRLKCRNSLQHIQMLMHKDGSKEVTLEYIRTEQTPISAWDHHHDAQIKSKSSGQTHRKLYEMISCNRFIHLPLFSVPFC